MNRIPDEEKITNALVEYTKTHDVFTTEMLYDYILNRKIKFKKMLIVKRLGRNIARHPLLEKAYKKNNINYYKVKEGSE